MRIEGRKLNAWLLSVACRKGINESDAGMIHPDVKRIENDSSIRQSHPTQSHNDFDPTRSVCHVEAIMVLGSQDKGNLSKHCF